MDSQRQAAEAAAREIVRTHPELVQPGGASKGIAAIILRHMQPEPASDGGTVHELKTWPHSFHAIKCGDKHHEVRKHDRNFAVGDTLRLREWIPPADDQHEGQYTGDELLVRVTYISEGGNWGIPDGLCVMSIQPIAAQPASDGVEVERYMSEALDPSPCTTSQDAELKRLRQPIHVKRGDMEIKLDPARRDVCEAHIGRLLEIVSKLARTADGVIVVEDRVGPQTVFVNNSRATPLKVTSGLIANVAMWRRCYSTPEAALAAQKQKADSDSSRGDSATGD